MIEKWIITTFRKYPWADFCLECGHFIGDEGYCYKKHIVVGRPAKARLKLKREVN